MNSISDQNGVNNLTADSKFKFMPILKNATSKNFVPLYDYE